jgi:hypothetical protein
MQPASKVNLLPEFAGKRTLKIALRTAHLLAISVICGAILLDVSHATLHYYWLAAISTGIAMLLIDALSNMVWFVQVRGMIIGLKLLLLMMLPLAPDWGKLVIVIIMILSGTIAHAPGSWRYYSLWHGKVMKSLHDSKG